MSENLSKQQTSADEITLRELFALIWRGKWIILVVTFCFAVGSIFHSLSLPNIYAAEATLAPTEESQGGGGVGDMGGQLGGLASLAGIRVGQGRVTPAALALEILKSRAFIADFVNRRDIKVDLFAVSDWNELTGELTYNESVFDLATETWVRGVEHPRQPEPSDWEVVRAFRDVFSVQPDDQTGLVTLKVQHRSPIVAKQWVGWLVEDLNNKMRQRDIDEAKRSLEYISREMSNVQLQSTQQIYSNLMERQTQTIMLANIRPEYIYTVVDPAIVPEQRESPKRTLIVVIGTLLGGFLSLLLVLITYLFRHVD
ncbi:LPS O-antigen length regulator [Aliidiomarina minuta]|uniref:LPS O-antigen length regulator n=1 Tax=Aliidiomarina minuta TaxID=880057 RepID=A0A432W8D1_9GAMM|nr:Wzz/FepE/Etk N-terminal domain-containing protein [Aliidiomarina minuta]RUO26281.1 LPS O-antigen length regulator [Aliidiomarina minuta]